MEHLMIGLAAGVALGAVGSLTGIGGGFLLMPVLLVLWPEAPAASLSVLTLLVVLVNSAVGVSAASLRSTIRLRTGLAYAGFSLPFVWAGVELQALLARSVFSTSFGVLLVLGALVLFLRPQPQKPEPTTARRWWAGGIASAAIGIVSGLFGVGGGFLFTPLLAFGLRFRWPEATATSQLTVGLASLAALWANRGAPIDGLDPWGFAGLLAGVVMGSPLGVAASQKWNPVWMVRLLAGLLLLGAVKFLVL